MPATDALPFFAILFENAVSVAFSTFLVGMLVMIGSVETTRNVVETIIANPPHSFRAGFAVVLTGLAVFVPLFLLTPTTRLLAWLVWLVLAGLLVFGRAYAFIYVGTKLSGDHDTPIAALLSGSASAFFLSLVPILGQLVVGAFAVLGIGGMVGRVAVWSQSTSSPAANP